MAIMYRHEAATCSTSIKARLLRTNFREVLFAAVQLVHSSDTNSEAALIFGSLMNSESLLRLCVSRRLPYPSEASRGYEVSPLLRCRHWYSSHGHQSAKLRLCMDMVFLRSSVEGITTTFFGKTIKKPERSFPKQASDTTMTQDTSHKDNAAHALDVDSKEQKTSDSASSAGIIVAAQPHHTSRPIFWPDKFKPMRGARSEHGRLDNEETETTYSQHQYPEREPFSPPARTDAQEADHGGDSKAKKDIMHLRGGDLEEDCCAGLFGGLCLSFACLQVFCPDPQ